MTKITEHEWSDEDIQGVTVCDHHIMIESLTEDNEINKSDAIAIAKHFGLLDSVSVPFSQTEVTIGESVTICSETDRLLSGANGQQNNPKASDRSLAFAMGVKGYND